MLEQLCPNASKFSVCVLVTGQKYEFAKKWKIHIVDPQWVSDSIDAGHCLEEHKYRVDDQGGGRAASTSTPSTSNAQSRGQSRLNLEVLIALCQASTPQ